MKFHSIYILIIGCLLSCTGELAKLNKNPNGLDEINYGKQFTTVQLYYAGTAHEVWRANLIYASSIVKHTASRYTNGQGFKLKYSYNDAQWDVNYPNLIKNVEDLLKRLKNDNSNGKNDNLIAATRLMRVLAYHRLTDLYGDIPYSEAGKGYENQIFLPRYDSQEFIYKDMLKELTEVVKQLDESKKNFGTQDLFYSGDVIKWKQLANSVKLRLGMRLTKVDYELASKTVKEAIDGGVMTNADNSAVIKHYLSGGVWGTHENSLGSVVSRLAGGDPWSYLSEFMVEKLKNDRDIRLFYWGEVVDEQYKHITLSNYNPFQANNSAGNPWQNVAIVGMPSGDIDATINAKYYIKNEEELTLQTYDYRATANARNKPSSANNSFFRINQQCVASRVAPTFVVGFDEVSFLIAEAKIRGMIDAADAETNFASGVKFAFDKLKSYPNQNVVNNDIEKAGLVGENEVGGYLNRKKRQWQEADKYGKLELIGEEKWKSFFPNGLEAFAEWRRSGFPKELNKTESAEKEINVYAKQNLDDVIEIKKIKIHTGGDTNYQRIRRLVFTAGELSINRENVQMAINRMKGNELTTRVWWDKIID